MVPNDHEMEILMNCKKDMKVERNDKVWKEPKIREIEKAWFINVDRC